MYVANGADWAVANSNRRQHVVGLTSDDLRNELGDEAVNKMTLVEIHDELSKRTDILVVKYLIDEKELTPEYGLERIQEIKNG